MAHASRRADRTLHGLSIGEVSRADAIPTGVKYQDTGCHVHPACLSCPLEQCIYDAPQESRQRRAISNQRQVREAYERGLGVAEIAHELGVSLRTVHRHLRELRAPTRSRNIAFEHAGWH